MNVQQTTVDAQLTYQPVLIDLVMIQFVPAKPDILVTASPVIEQVSNLYLSIAHLRINLKITIQVRLK